MIIHRTGKYIANASRNVQCAPARIEYVELLQLIIIIIIIIITIIIIIVSLLWRHWTADQRRLTYKSELGLRATYNA